MIVARGEELHSVTLTICDRHEARVWNDGNPLRFTKPWQAPDVIDQVRRAVLKKDRELALYDVRPMDEYVDVSVASARFQTLLLTLFAALALVLTAVGLYGVLAYTVAQRTREFGIRLALGARPREVMRLILLNATRMVAIGVLVGVGGAALHHAAARHRAL